MKPQNFSQLYARLRKELYAAEACLRESPSPEDRDIAFACSELDYMIDAALERLRVRRLHPPLRAGYIYDLFPMDG